MATYNIDLQDYEGNSYQPKANPDSVAEFTQASSRSNIKPGETHRTIFGKIAAFLGAFGGAAYVALANNCSTTEAGFALDARQGKALMDKFNQLNSEIKTVNVYVGSDGKLHFVNSGGADSVLPFNKVSYTDFSIPEGITEKVISLSDIPGSTEIIGAGATERIYTGWTGLSVSYTSTQVTISWGIDTGAGNRPVNAYGNWKVRVWWR